MDIQTAKELKSTLMWAGIVEEMDKKIHYESQKLRTCKPEDLLLIQARIDIFEQVKRLPDDVVEREE